MFSQKENAGEKRKRKIVSRPVLVRSVKPSGTSSDYTKASHNNPFWKAA